MLAGGLHARSYSNIHLACGPLGLGEDCAGLGSIGLAFKELDVPFKYNFASEKEDAIRCIHHTLHPELETKLFFNDLAERDNKKAPGCHVYGFGGPCQPWSPAGKEEGINRRSRLCAFQLYGLREAEAPTANPHGKCGLPDA